MAVHPHASGEHDGCRDIGQRGYGSSPREWGTHKVVPGYTVKNRFIPTRVGNTSSCPLKIIAVSVHPHASGEHFARTDCAWFHDGSSPREWGTLRFVKRMSEAYRFIPTRVGNTPNSPP